MVTSTEAASTSPAPDPIPPPSNGQDLLSFPILKPRSKRRPAKFPPATPSVADDVEERPWKLRSLGAGPGPAARTRRGQRARFSVALSSEEIEEDIYAVTGSRPRRRPKKRPRLLQKQIDLVFPGLWLTEVTLDLYRVPDDR